jgi:hypothetical protein
MLLVGGQRAQVLRWSGASSNLSHLTAHLSHTLTTRELSKARNIRCDARLVREQEYCSRLK